MKKSKVVYEDDLVIVEVPHEDDLVTMVYDVFKQLDRPVFLKELIGMLNDYASQRRVRRAVEILLIQGAITVYPDGRLGLPGLEFTRVKRKGKRIMVPEVFKVREKWL